MGEHARLAPSSAHRWVPCPGSVQLEEKYPETSVHEMTLEGTAIHEVAATVLGDYLYHDQKGHTFNRASFLNTTASNGVVVTNEMLDVAEVYIRDVIQQSTRFKGPAKVFLEYRVQMPDVHPENWGTLDAAILFYDMDSRVLVVEDLKAGWGIVEVWDNWQLIDYTLGLLNDMQERSWPLPETIELRLVQPRPYHRNGPIRVQTFTRLELEPYRLKLQESALNALSPTPRFTSGEHCAHCRGRANCPALLQSGYKVVEAINGIQSQELTGVSLGKHLAMLEEARSLLKALESALQDKALIELQQGRQVPGYTWETKESRVKWTKSIAEVHAMGDLCGVDLRKLDAPTPKQAISLGMPENIVNSMSASSGSGIRLAALDLRTTAKIFNQQE